MEDIAFLKSAVDFQARLVGDAEEALAKVVAKKERILTEAVAAVDVQILEAQEGLLNRHSELEDWKTQLAQAEAAASAAEEGDA